MEDLRALYEKLGLKNIVIYIQSGNVIFQTGDLPEPDLVEFLEDAIEKKFGFHVPVLIRSFQELSLIQQSNPFLDDPGVDIKRLYVTFLEKTPLESLIKSLSEIGPSPERFELINREVFLYCPMGYGRTRLSNNFFENRLKLKATTRNWNTVCTLVDIAR